MNNYNFTKGWALGVLIFIAACVNAQAPDYFANKPEWRQSSDCAIGYPCVEEQEYVYYLNGDSTVENVSYKKVYKHGAALKRWYDSPPVPSYCEGSSTFNQFHALVRQENYKIYILLMNQEEALLYDFELAVGDTLPIAWNQGNENTVVTSIDSLLVGDTYRKVFNISGSGSTMLIEGIGHDGGFLEPFPPIFDCGHFLICFALNDTTYYPNFGDYCDLSVDVPLPPIAKQIKAYPNPVTSKLILEIQEASFIKEIIAINMKGEKTVLEFTPMNHLALNVEMSRLPNGLYIIQLMDKEGNIFWLKVLKDS